MADTRNRKVRVRFAPSPTGHLHVGGARTALYNWLFARSRGGTFILRIEDTDRERSTEQAIDQIIAGMRWLGLEWDEGPRIGGEHGPYRQMERMGLYQEQARRLLEEGRAYRCYCTEEELDGARSRAREKGETYVYDGRCRGLDDEARASFEAEGRRSVLRLKTPPAGQTLVNDLIHGEVGFDNALCGDFILVRSSGIPTYNFAVAVDDLSMGITHVIRGDDHLPNTPRQLMVIEALAGEPPAYAHLPMILGPDRSPLSKRHGDVSVEQFRDHGYVREAMCNYLALLGWSYDAETTLFSMEELVEKFSLERVGSTAAAFDRDKLLWMNGRYIREMEPVELAERLESFLPSTRLAGLPGTEGRPEITDLVPLVQEKLKTLADFVELTDFFFAGVKFEEKALDKLMSIAEAPAMLRVAARILAEVEPYRTETIDEALRQAADEMEVKLGKFLQPLRIAVSGKTVTPGMFETLSVLGREESIRRIEAALEMKGLGGAKL